MDTILPPNQLALTENHVVRLYKAKGTQIACLAGVVWITIHNSAEDIILKPGEGYTIPNQGLALMEAATSAAARVRITHEETPDAFFSTCFTPYHKKTPEPVTMPHVPPDSAQNRYVSAWRHALLPAVFLK